MKKSHFLLIAALFASTSWAQVGIASGQKTGTNYAMTEDIVKVCSVPGAKINNVISDGSLDSLSKISTDKSTQYGIIQADAALYQQGQDPKMMEKIVMVFPLFSTEIHVIAKQGTPIKNLADLAGKRVVEGPENSGTWVTAQMVKYLTGIQWIPLTMSMQGGMDAVKSGAVDAEFIVAGMPIGLLQNQPLQLVSLNHPKMEQFYTKAIIPSGKYTFQTGSVSTYKVDNLLATYAFKNQYQKEIGALVTCMAKNIDKLQGGEFHAKWKDVDPFDIDRIKWASHPAAVAAIKREAKHK